MFNWFKKKKEVTTPIISQPINYTYQKHTLCRVHFYVPNDVIILPYILEYCYVDNEMTYKPKVSMNQLLQWAIASFRINGDLSGYYLNNKFYPNHVLTKVEISDINTDYVEIST